MSAGPARRVNNTFERVGDPSSAVDYLSHLREVSDDRVAYALTMCDQVSEVNHCLLSVFPPANVCPVACGLLRGKS